MEQPNKNRFEFEDKPLSQLYADMSKPAQKMSFWNSGSGQNPVNEKLKCTCGYCNEDGKLTVSGLVRMMKDGGIFE